jgi:hypothetical protein
MEVMGRKKEDKGSYWITLREEKKGTGNWKRMHHVTLSGQLALEEAVDSP